MLHSPHFTPSEKGVPVHGNQESGVEDPIVVSHRQEKNRGNPEVP